VRLALARIAVEHAVDGAIDPDHVWVVGDTPRDAACARDNGVHCLLVATGTYGLEELESQGADHVLTDLADVDRVVGLIRRNEYKRRQAAVGPRITPRGFGKDWRYPIAARFT
jgi:ribonucleotide monophosphatase NagD (HAD superfamily)